MSSESNDQKDRALFKYYLEHGYFPLDIGTANKNNTFNHNNKSSLSIEDDMSNHIKKINSHTTQKIEAEINIECSLDDEKLFLDSINSFDFTNYNKDSIDSNYKPERSKKKVKPHKLSIPNKHKLDLHGLTREPALRELKSFVKQAYHAGIRYILVVHGQGYGSKGGVAVLKDLVESYVVTEGIEYIDHSYLAPASQGGDGARVICMKEKKR